MVFVSSLVLPVDRVSPSCQKESAPIPAELRAVVCHGDSTVTWLFGYPGFELASLEHPLSSRASKWIVGVDELTIFLKQAGLISGNASSSVVSDPW